MAYKVRRVRCPRCWSILDELPGVLLYRCGGCGNTLEAKTGKLGSERSVFSSQETNNIVKSPEADASEDKGARSSVHVSTGPSSLQSSPDKDGTCFQDVHRDINGVICEEKGFPDALPSSLKSTCLNEGAYIEDQEPLKQDNLRGQGSEGCNSELNDDNGGLIGGSSSGSPGSGEFTHKMEMYAAEPIEHLEQEEKSCLQEGRVFQRMCHEGGEFAYAVRESPDIEDTENALPPNIEHRDGNVQNDVPQENDGKGPCSSPDQEQDSERGTKLNGLPFDFVSHENGNAAPRLPEQGIEANEMAAESSLTTSPEKIMNFSSSDSLVTGQRSFDDSLASYLTCPEDEPCPSVGTLDNFEKASMLAGLSSELNFKQRSMLSNLPISNDYYGYGDSGNACDSMDEQISGRLSSRKGKGKDVGGTRTTKMLINNTFKEVNVNRKPERDYRMTNSYRATRNSNWGQEKYAETKGYVSENILKRDKQGVGSNLLHYSGDPVIGRITHGHSRNHHNLLPPRPHIHSSSQASYMKMDKLDLLRTMDSLKDQVNRMQFPEAMTKRRFPDRVVDGKFNSFNYGRLATEHEIYPDLNLPGAYLRHDQSKGCPAQYKISRMGYSGEASYHGHHIGCACLQCCSQNRRYSAQFPLHSHHFQNDRCRSSELPLYDAKSDYLRVDEIRRSQVQEKHRAVKSYARPIAGAAPFLACYHCSKLLLLPADFLVLKKRYHELMCSACKKVLTFSLEKGTHLVPYIPDASAPSPSEADNYSRNLECPSHSNSCQRVETGWSFCRRCSMQGVLERIESVGSSTRLIPKYINATSEIKDLPPSSTHRLHHLMGYSSPSQVLYD